MTTYQITAPRKVTTRIGAADTGCRIILGTGYTTHDSIADYARRKLYAVNEVEEIPAEYLEQCDRLDAFPIQADAPLIDAIDPASMYNLDLPGSLRLPDGRSQIDIRDVISGAITADPNGLVINGPLTA